MAPRTRAGAVQAATASAKQVFDTYELLENILLHLPMENIFTVQRVSRQWQSLIGQSSRLQQAIFLQAAPPLVCWRRQGYRRKTKLTKLPDTSKAYAALKPDDSPVEFLSRGMYELDPWDSDDSEGEHNYAHVSYEDASGLRHEGKRSRESGLLKPEIIVGAIANPLLFPHDDMNRGRSITATCSHRGLWSFSQSLYIERAESHDQSATGWPDMAGSYADMYLTQPPATTFRWQSLDGRDECYGYGTMARAGGVRVQDVLRFLGPWDFGDGTSRIEKCELAPVGMLFPTEEEASMPRLPAISNASAEEKDGS